VQQRRHNGTAPALRVRRLVQVGFLVLVAGIALGHTLEEQGVTIPLVGGASLHAVCPFGGVVSIYEYVTEGSFVRKTHESSWALMWIAFGTAILFGPAFCGWICPLGTVQEWVGRLGRRIFRKRYNAFIPQRLDGALRYLRYLVLAWVVYVTAVTGTLVFAEIDPYFALFNFWTGEVALSAFVVLGVTLLAALFVERPFCKYACPYGAVLGLLVLGSSLPRGTRYSAFSGRPR
jgi:hypothetical protein